jgi:hypothetical protein
VLNLDLALGGLSGKEDIKPRNDIVHLLQRMVPCDIPSSYQKEFQLSHTRLGYMYQSNILVIVAQGALKACQKQRKQRVNNNAKRAG